MPADRIVVERTVSYSLRNITRGDIANYPVRARITNPHEPISVKAGDTTRQIPAHTKLMIDEKEVDISKSVRGVTLEHTIRIPEGASPVVSTTAEEPVALRDSNAYTLMTPTVRLTVRIVNELKDIIRVTNVSLLLRREFSRLPNGDYEYRGALLPGQTFTVTWEPKPAVTSAAA
jgi:hypothetical protein